MRTRILLPFVIALAWPRAPVHAAEPAAPRVIRFVNESTVELGSGAAQHVVRIGERFGVWTLLAIVPEGAGYAVVQNFTDKLGHLVFIAREAVRLDLSQTLESTAADPRALLLGHTQREVLASATDRLADEILARPGDPSYEAVAPVFEPIRHVKLGTYDFVGTPDSSEKVGFTYGGRSPNFDPAVYQPSIAQVREQGRVERGLVGGDLPVLRFVYPEADEAWTELLAFAPFRVDDANPRVQPVWYRVSRVEAGRLVWSRCYDSYHPVPPRTAARPAAFYADLARLEQRWHALLAPGMQVELPEARVANLARLSLVRALATRVGDWPKYGVIDRDYGGSEHDGFPDTFNVETSALVEWGLLERAGRYIDNYFGHFVRDDGSLLYRGPEFGQYGRMLTVVAQYASAGGDPGVLLARRTRIDAVAKLLIGQRKRALALPDTDPAHGMIAGFCEADSCLEREPSRYMLPYFSNSTEAARGLRDLGRVWRALAEVNGSSELRAWGEQLGEEAELLRRDLARSLARSVLVVDGKPMLPAIAGAREPFDVAGRRDPSDPQFRAYRAYMEMMHSGNLTRDQVELIVDYRRSHRDVLLGVPTAYGYASRELAGFLTYGYGYGLLQIDHVREALLTLYSDMAHGYTRGSWMAPETTRPVSNAEAAPYCTPAQLTAALLIRWLLVFEDPEAERLWLGKGVPRAWLQDGKVIRVRAAPTRWGRVGFSLVSHAATGAIAATVELPASGLRAETLLRVRANAGARMRAVQLAGRPWTQFDPAQETVTIPAGMGGVIDVSIHY